MRTKLEDTIQLEGSQLRTLFCKYVAHIFMAIVLNLVQKLFSTNEMLDNVRHFDILGKVSQSYAG